MARPSLHIRLQLAIGDAPFEHPVLQASEPPEQAAAASWPSVTSRVAANGWRSVGPGPQHLALDAAGLPMDRIAAFCRKHRIRRLAPFRWALRDDFTQESHIDVLVEFEPGISVGWAFFRLNTDGFLSRCFRDRVLAEAKDLHVAA